MDHKSRYASGRASCEERPQTFFRVLIVDSQPAFDGDGDRDALAHYGNAFCYQCRLAHQAGAEATRLHAIRRTSDIQIDLVIAKIRADLCCLSKPRRLGTAQLKRHRMLERIEADQPLAIAA